MKFLIIIFYSDCTSPAWCWLKCEKMLRLFMALWDGWRRQSSCYVEPRCLLGKCSELSCWCCWTLIHSPSLFLFLSLKPGSNLGIVQFHMNTVWLRERARERKPLKTLNMENAQAIYSPSSFTPASAINIWLPLIYWIKLFITPPLHFLTQEGAKTF